MSDALENALKNLVSGEKVMDEPVGRLKAIAAAAMALRKELTAVAWGIVALDQRLDKIIQLMEKGKES